MSKAAAQEAASLAQKLGAMEHVVEYLDEEAERLVGKYVMEAEQNRRLQRLMEMLKNELEVRKTWPGPLHNVQFISSISGIWLAEADRKVKEAREKAKKALEKSQLHMTIYHEDVQANLARDHREPAPAHFRREFLDSGAKKALDAARAVWHQRFLCQLPEIMTTDQCNEALKIRYDLLRYGSATRRCRSKHGTQREPPPCNVCRQYTIPPRPLPPAPFDPALQRCRGRGGAATRGSGVRRRGRAAEARRAHDRL
jgi:hypothetical protein